MTHDQDCGEPFQVVLIDIKKASNFEIHCVKKPLTKELKYVAISYRWGELHETSIDTGVGYVASITSFDLQDFYRLCDCITKEPDLRSIPYVWVDAICVNQTNHDERKSTIYRMTDIYEYASWILAVPDLHAEHLRHFNVYRQAIYSFCSYQSYLYHLLHGNISILHEREQGFLDSIEVPKDSRLRQLLTNHTSHFVNSFMGTQNRLPRLNKAFFLEHLYEVHSRNYEVRVKALQPIDAQINPRSMYEYLHRCDSHLCPIQSPSYYLRVGTKEWHQKIFKRGADIRQAMGFLTDLVVDSSSRVWVISEFHISKKKNNLKFWFAQWLNLSASTGGTFFKFDLNDPRFKAIENSDLGCNLDDTLKPVYITFYQQLIHQLNHQSILEMMLKSKASKHEDRFYSIFPLFSQYKQLLQNEALVNNTTSLLSVKLKLYNVLENKQRILLFMLSYNGQQSYTLPTFATSVINWPTRAAYKELASEPFLHNYKVTLSTTTEYLVLTSPGFYHSREMPYKNDKARRTLIQLLPKTLCLGSYMFLDMVWMFDAKVSLVGSYYKNIWILGNATPSPTVTYISRPFEFHVY